MSFHVPEKYRFQQPGHRLHSTEAIGNNGAFWVKLNRGQTVFVIASDGEGWEHVSVSRQDRCPTWEEMCQVKAIFWDGEDCVIQYHPPESEYVNNHPYCLHLWRPTDQAIPLPDSLLVGVKGVTL
jgi:hypothetical protein